MTTRTQIEERLQQAVEQEKFRQINEMFENNTLSLANKQLYLNGQIRNVGSYIIFDQGYIDLVYSQEIDNIARELEHSRMREEITELQFDSLMEVIN